VDNLEKAIKEYLEECYEGTEEDIAEAANAMYIYIVEHYIPDVISMFNIRREDTNEN
jgi:hypothetical protein